MYLLAKDCEPFLGSKGGNVARAWRGRGEVVDEARSVVTASWKGR